MLKKEKEKLKIIYVVGFPKSGNTWLTRLLADLLSCPAGFNTSRYNNDEIASDSNALFFKKNKNPKYKILKHHSLPQYFVAKNSRKPINVVYIKRDFRDVAVSCFFHHNNFDSVKEKKIELKDYRKLSPIECMKYCLGRIRFIIYIKNISKRWLGGDRVGSWGKHIEAWEKMAERDDCNVVFTSYEKMLRNTKGEIMRIIDTLNLEIPLKNNMNQSIERQSFKEKKKQLNNLLNDSSIPFGKEFNVKFLRKGIVGDWKRFFSKRTAKIVIKEQGKFLIRYGYVKDNSWYLNINR